MTTTKAIPEKIFNKVYVIGPDYQTRRMFREKNYLLVNDLKNADIVVFTGGSDISPAYYGESLKHPKTYCDPERDFTEKKIYKFCVKHGKKLVGICRGGQFLNVMNGGKMWQHVNNHATSKPHKAYTTYTDGSKREIMVTSTHHQMMIPHPERGRVLLTANESTTIEYPNGSPAKNNGDDVEVVWYPGTDSLCFQPHPEYRDAQFGRNNCHDYFFELVNELIQVKRK